MRNNRGVHFSQDDSSPNIELIIETLVSSNILPPGVTPSNWRSSITEIIRNLSDWLRTNRALQTETEEGFVDVFLEIHGFKVSVEEEPLKGLYMFPLASHELWFQSLGEANKRLLENILRNKAVIENTIKEILYHSLRFGSLGYSARIYGEGTQPDNLFLTKIIPNIEFVSSFLKKSIKAFYSAKEKRPAVVGGVSSEDREVLETIEKNLKQILLQKIIEIRVSKIEFIAAFLSKIEILGYEQNLEEKNKLIEQFKYRKTLKQDQATAYFTAAYCIFSCLLIVNLYIFMHKLDNQAIDIWQFIDNFLGRGIYFFIVEILALFLAFYFLGLFRSYLKLIELYDSHILLIEADFFYKNDRHFNHPENQKELFLMRKENTQKIHSLPERTLDLLNGKTAFHEEPSAIKLAEQALEAFNAYLGGKK